MSCKQPTRAPSPASPEHHQEGSPGAEPGVTPTGWHPRNGVTSQPGLKQGRQLTLLPLPEQKRPFPWRLGALRGGPQHAFPPQNGPGQVAVLFCKLKGKMSWGGGAGAGAPSSRPHARARTHAAEPGRRTRAPPSRVPAFPRPPAPPHPPIGPGSRRVGVRGPSPAPRARWAPWSPCLGHAPGSHTPTGAGPRAG